MTSALVILSGGQDSTWCLSWAMDRYNVVDAITYDYGQRHERELKAAITVCRMLGVERHDIVNLRGAFEGTSPLTDHNAKLERYRSVEEMEERVGDSVETTFVPGRNAVFLAVACGIAKARGIDDVVIGVSQEDDANYPDCRVSFLTAMTQAMRYAVANDRMTIHAPLARMKKKDALVHAHANTPLWEALAFTHTAYDGSYPPNGDDHASILRAKAFLDAGFPDPLILRAFHEGHLASLPTTSNYKNVAGTTSEEPTR